ncbi:MAG: hypothetical protein RJA70_1458 [Pseudomonadota bacterium]|jgi:hypothetical protein
MKRRTLNAHRRLDRRTVLKGAVGASLALPWLEVYQSTASAQVAVPLRLVVIIHPNGVRPEEWFPDTVGRDYDIKFSLEPLAPFKDRMIVFSGVNNLAARNAGGNGHTAAAPRLLTCADDGPSIDQLIAKEISKGLAIPSLNVGVQTNNISGGSIRGRYSYPTNRASAIVPSESPQEVFNSLSGLFVPDSPEAQATAERIRAGRRSFLDFVASDAQATAAALGGADKARLDQYVTGLREMELSVANQVNFSCKPPEMPPAGIDVQADASVAIVANQMLKLTQFAMQCDLTRVGVFQINGEQSSISYGDIDDPIVAGVPMGHHGNSHSGGHNVARICQLHSKFVADFAAGLDAITEGSGTMLDNTIILYTNAMHDGQKHDYTSMPHVLIGGTKALSTGQHLSFDSATTNSNDLYVTLAQAFGLDLPSFGDTKYFRGPLAGVLA